MPGFSHPSEMRAPYHCVFTQRVSASTLFTFSEYCLAVLLCLFNVHGLVWSQYVFWQMYHFLKIRITFPIRRQ